MFAERHRRNASIVLFTLLWVWCAHALAYEFAGGSGQPNDLHLTAAAKYGGGTGTPNDPYLICTAEQMNMIGTNKYDWWGKHFRLMADIDLSSYPGSSYNIVGAYGVPFTGVFDGNGHTISNLRISDKSLAGLFGYVDGPSAQIKNLVLSTPNIQKGSAGGVWFGAIVAYVKSGTVLNCYVKDVSISVKGGHYIGGILGLNYGTVTDCHVSGGSISAPDGESVGGLVGSNEGMVDGCSSTVDVSGTGTSYYFGGVAGESFGRVSNCWSSGRISAGYSNSGGIVGFNKGIISECWATGVVSSYYSSGGVVGGNSDSKAVIRNCHSHSSVSGNRQIGGLVGYDNGSIADCYSASTVDGVYNVGGLVGKKSGGTVTKSYSTGTVLGALDVGGLVGLVDKGSVTSSFWDIETSGQVTSAGGAGKTTAEMQQAKTFLDAGWDFVGETKNGPADLWWINEGKDYPRLWWEPVNEEKHVEYSGGSGEPNDPYQIATAADLIVLGGDPNDYDRHFILTADIDMDPNLDGRKVFDRAVIAPDTNDSAGWFEGTSFAGVFDGNNHTISHLTVTGTRFLGLFGDVSGEVKNLGIVDVNITGSGDYVGGLAGLSTGRITRSYNTGTVSGRTWAWGEDDLAGGLVGANWGGIADSYSTGAVNGCYAGGLVGENRGVITSCHSAGTVSGYWVGGLVGENNRSGVLANCYSTGIVEGDTVGGLVGINQGLGVVTNCYSTGAVISGFCVGGLVGYSGGTVNGSFWDTQTSGRTSSSGGAGKTTAEMRTASTFLGTGWDFVGETANGTEEIWRINEGKDYPRLSWELTGPSPQK